MSQSRFAPHQIRTRYLHALNALPLAVRLADTPDAAALTVLGTATVADRTVHFGTTASAPRLWIAVSGADPAMLGYVSGLVVGEPDLWVCNEAHRAWALQGANTRELKQAAARVWFACQRDCEG